MKLIDTTKLNFWILNSIGKDRLDRIRFQKLKKKLIEEQIHCDKQRNSERMYSKVYIKV